MTPVPVRPIVRALAAATFLGGLVSVVLWPAVSLAQTAGSGPSTGAADSARDAKPPSGSAKTAPTQADQPKQAAFDPLAARVRYLHNRLRVTQAQEPLWAGLVQVMQENAKSVEPLLKQQFQAAKSGNAIDALSTYEKLGAAQLDGLRKFTAAFEALYNSLTDDQKKLADVVFRPAQFSEQLAEPLPYPSYPVLPAYTYYAPLPLPPPYYARNTFFYFVSPVGPRPSRFVYPRFVPLHPRVLGAAPPGRAALMHGAFRRR